MSLILTAAFLLIGCAKQYIPSHRFLFLSAFLYVVMLPGYLATLRLCPWASGTLRVLASFIWGTVIAYIILFITALVRTDIRIVGLVVPAIVVTWTIGTSLHRTAKDTAQDVERTDHPRENRAAVAMLIALIIAVSIVIVGRGDPLFYTSDSADHIAYIRTITRMREAFPEQFYYRDGGMLTHDIRKGMGQALFGTLNALTGREDVVDVWPLMSLVSSIFIIVALFCAGSVLFGSSVLGLTASVLYVLFYNGGLRGHDLTSSAAGYLFGRTFYVAAFAFLPVSLSSARFRYVPFIVASAVAATMSHIGHFATLVFLAGTLALASGIGSPPTGRRDRIRRGFLVGLMIVLANIPYLLFRYVRDYAPNNTIHTAVQGVLFLTNKLFVLSPLVYVQVAGPLGILSAIAIPLLWRKSRSDVNLRLLLCCQIAVYVLIFNPLWFPFLLEKLSYLLARFEFAVPSMVLCAYLLRELWTKMRRRNPDLHPISAAVALVAVIALLGVPLVKLPAQWPYGGSTRRLIEEASFRNLNDLFVFIGTHCPRGSTFASDPITSYGIPAFTDAYVMCPYDQHSTPNDSTALKRIVDCRNMFSPETPLAGIRKVMSTYGAEYLVINGRIPPYLETMYWKPDRNAARSLSDRLRESTSPFRIEFEAEGITVARLTVCPSCREVERTQARIGFVGDSLLAEAIQLLPPSGTRGIHIEKLLPGRAEAARGDTISIKIVWVAAEKRKPGSYGAYLRFDTDFPKGILYRDAVGKPYRKLLEGVTGHRFRFRFDFQPLGGILPPDTWPLLREVRDEVRVPIPNDVAPGTYTISLKMVEKPQFPNYVLRDILTDNDFYSGAVLGTIHVR